MDVLGPSGGARMFLAEREGEPLAAVLVTAFGRTLTAKLPGLAPARKFHSGEFLYSNLLHWAARHGFRWFNFGGLPRGYASELLAGAEPGDYPESGAADFKRAFGGTPILFRDPYVIIPNPIFRAGFRQFAKYSGAIQRAHALLNGLRYL